MAHSANGDWHYDDASWRTFAVPTRGSACGSDLRPGTPAREAFRLPFLLWSLALERHRRQTGMVFVGFETDRIDVEEPSIHIWPSGALGVWPPTNVNHVASCCPPAHARLYRPPWQMRRSTQL